ncbi:MAG: GAK system XXXCH domain-containing protein [Desulfarculus sp.]|nr:GAK system XXXCH domain-containing protein [Pseudomonadota bacterium]MBV1715629.1 GAK system XXXCH domain-containing protein [Desulfarculus sp.]MBU4576467.1 GAK system XXXCH domain-containing protein [Pseudomonadota bacterium]MBU4600127.1 GAK system XXXCH domain-containing protein [Pseudomonadota bacterium]MBV1738839.1 GAK system XXXCH domain-containing protein [Desulfarculus sp.]
MDTPKKDKVKHRFSPAEAADYLRQLADALEQGHIALRSEDLGLEGEVKVKQALKTKSGKATLKINLKIVAPMPVAAPDISPAKGEAQGESEGFVEITAPEEEPAESEDKTSYKKIKKALAKSLPGLKSIRKEGGMPSLADASAFLAQAREVCTFDKAKYGSENYPRFLAALNRVEDALATANGSALDEALDEVGQCKSDCHEKFK